MTKIKIRRLKVYTKFRERTYDNTIVPELRLGGRWLEKAGFTTGQRVKIFQEPGRLIITLEEESTS